jgi:Fic family protein
VRVQDALTVYHVAPPQEEVDGLMRDRLEWLEHKRTSAEYFDSVLAAIGHFEIAEVHPFADYNGRAARLFAVAILTREGSTAKRLFSPERYYADGRDAYYIALRAIKTTRNLDAWLEYFVTGLASEFERVAETVEQLNRVTGAVESTIQLSRHQERIVAALTVGDRRDLTRAEAESVTGLEKTQTHAALSELVGAGILRVRGAGNRTVYELASRLRARPKENRRRGPAASWTEDRIRAELGDLAKDLGRMPKRADFSAAGRTGLYIAASKAGGIRRWAAELGYASERETRNS